VAEAKTLGITVSHMTVGNEEYGSWETDLHSTPHDPTIYAAAVAGTNGYYALIKKANSSTLVGVEVEPNYAPWDQDVMSNAPYDFVEYHYYPETPGSESDSFLVNQAAQNLTANINTIRAELVKWGTPNTPIFVGEIGGPYSNPGKQSWSISQGLYAGQVLGEMMNDGVSRLTWWIGFGNCNGDNGNDSSSLYGWQNFGAYNVFADGAGDTGGTNNSPCNYGGPTGTMSPTARAFQLFSNVAVTGESVLTASVTGDTADVVAYAATHSGGTALVLFNRNETTAEPVVVTFSGQSNSSGVTVITYDKAIYDQSSSTTPVWAAPTTTNLGAQSLPLSLTLTPWSMNVVLIK
jgi:alpha-L-arabinofuranosidase